MGRFIIRITPAKRCVSGDDCGVLQDEALSTAGAKQIEVLISAVLIIRQIEVELKRSVWSARQRVFSQFHLYSHGFQEVHLTMINIKHSSRCVKGTGSPFRVILPVGILLVAVFPDICALLR